MAEIVRMTLHEIDAAGRIDIARVEATTEEEIRRQMVEDGEDPDAALPNDWSVDGHIRSPRVTRP